MNNAEYDELVGRIYEACLDPISWNNIVESIAKITGARSAALGYWDVSVTNANVYAVHNIAPAWTELYHKEYAYIEKDPGIELMQRLEVGKMVPIYSTDDEREVLHASPVYKDCFAPQGMEYFAGGAIIREESKMAALSLQRGEAEGQFTESGLAELNRLVPHIQRSLKMHHDISLLRHDNLILHSVIDKLAQGIIVFDAASRVVFTNPIADFILNTHPAVCLSDGKLQSPEVELNNTLQSALTNTIETGEKNALPLRHKGANQPLPLLVMPISSVDISALSSVDASFKAIGFINDLESTWKLDSDTLKSLYQFTPSEIEVALMLINGLKPMEIANVRGCSVDTIRTQLKTIFKKAEVSGQIELMNKLLRSPSALLHS